MINKHETIYQELTPKEIRDQYGLELDEDVEKYIRNINSQSKGKKIKIIYKRGDKNEWRIYEYGWSTETFGNAKVSVQWETSTSSFKGIQ